MILSSSLFVSRSEMAAQGRRVVEALGGKWHGERGQCRCPAHDDRTPSLSVRVGDQALLFKCFGGCRVAVVLQALRRLDAAALVVRTSDRGLRPSDSWTRSRIADLWRAAGPVSGTIARSYLAARGIELQSSALRFHPRTPLVVNRRLYLRPALLAAVREKADLVALQRTFLDPNDPGQCRPDARRMFGRPGHGAVRLASHGPILGLAEGIETALSAMQLLRIPIWATLGTERFARIALPADVERLVLLPDNDAAGQAACRRARSAYATRKRTVLSLLPPMPAGDWNDVLRLALDPTPQRRTIFAARRDRS